MAAFLITYDLPGPDRDYEALFKSIKKLANGYARPLESVWIISSASSASEIRDALQSHINGKDQLLVVKLEGSWASLNIDREVTTWLKDTL